MSLIKKIKRLMLTGAKLAESYENDGEFDEAYKEYYKIGDFIKAGKILEKTEKWHEAANLYIQTKQTDLARRAIENCFKRDESWEMYELGNGGKISIEDWLKKNHQIRRFARYVRYVEVLNNQKIPIIVVLANKFKKVLEYKAAADLYKRGFDLTNKEKGSKKIQNEVWLKNAAECYSKAKLYPDAAQCMKELIVTEVSIGDALPTNGINPYRQYTHNLELAKEWRFLPILLEILEDFDPFNFAYDLLKMGEPELSMQVFFKYFGKVIKRDYSDKEIEIRNKRIQYCFNQYIIYYRDRKQYRKAAEIALLDSQKEIAAELFKKAEQEKEKSKAAPAVDVEEMETIEEPEENQKQEKAIPKKEVLKCPTCGEIVESDWEVCPSCDNTLILGMCVCGQKIKSHWKRCPVCQRELKQPEETQVNTNEDMAANEDTKPFTMPKKFVASD